MNFKKGNENFLEGEVFIYVVSHVNIGVESYPSLNIMQISRKEPLFEGGYNRNDFYLWLGNKLGNEHPFMNLRSFELNNLRVMRKYADEHDMDVVDYDVSYSEKSVEQSLFEGTDRYVSRYISLLKSMTYVAINEHKRKQIVRDVLFNGSDDSKIDVLDGLVDNMFSALNSNDDNEIKFVSKLIERVGNNLLPKYRVDEIVSVAEYGLNVLTSYASSERKRIVGIIPAYREFYTAMHNDNYPGMIEANKKISKLSKDMNIDGLIELHRRHNQERRDGRDLEADGFGIQIALAVDSPELKANL